MSPAHAARQHHAIDVTNPDCELFKQHRDEQSKYVYFILAAAAGGIALAVRVTSDAKLHWSLIPLGVGVVCWGFRFYYGCLQLQWVQEGTKKNAAQLKMARGDDPVVGTDPAMRKFAVEELKKIIDADIDRAAKYYMRQFYFLIGGAVLFIGWHVLQIILRSH